MYRTREGKQSLSYTFCVPVLEKTVCTFRAQGHGYILARVTTVSSGTQARPTLRVRRTSDFLHAAGGGSEEPILIRRLPQVLTTGIGEERRFSLQVTMPALLFVTVVVKLTSFSSDDSATTDCLPEAPRDAFSPCLRPGGPCVS
jgi:hypothetical protein